MENPEIVDKLNEILIKLQKIETDIEFLKQGANNMNEHISFVDSVYNTIKNPFYYVINKIKPIEQIPEKNKLLM
jgi:hypothetical protein